MKISLKLIDLCQNFIENLKKLNFDNDSIGMAFLTIGNNMLDEEFTELLLDEYLKRKEQEILNK